MNDQLSPDPGRNRHTAWLREMWRRREDESVTVFAILMAGIAMLFVAGIVSAFLFAKDTNPILQAEAPAASAPATTGSSGGADRQTPATAHEPETTGSGITATKPQVHPREDEQNENPQGENPR